MEGRPFKEVHLKVRDHREYVRREKGFRPYGRYGRMVGQVTGLQGTARMDTATDTLITPAVVCARKAHTGHPYNGHTGPPHNERDRRNAPHHTQCPSFIFLIMLYRSPWSCNVFSRNRDRKWDTVGTHLVMCYPPAHEIPVSLRPDT